MDNMTQGGATVTLQYSNSSGSTIAAGKPINLGSGLVGVAVADIADGASGAVVVGKGVFTLAYTPKASATVAVGDTLKVGTLVIHPNAYTGTASAITNGKAAGTATSASTTISVLLW